MDAFVSFTLEYDCPFVYAVYSSLVDRIIPFCLEDGTNQSDTNITYSHRYLNTDCHVATWPGKLKY